MSLSKRLKEARTALKIGQKEFAEAIGIIYQSLSKYERGEIKPTAELLTKIAETHKININWLLTGNGQMFLDQEKQPQGDCICKEREKMLAAFDKLPRERQEYYHYKIIAEALD